MDHDSGYCDQMLYINNSDDFTILGGTFWMDQVVEFFTQGKVISTTPSPVGGDGGHQTATIKSTKGTTTPHGVKATPRALTAASTAPTQSTTATQTAVSGTKTT